MCNYLDCPFEKKIDVSKLLILSVACLNGEISIKLWLSTCPAQTSSACATENNKIKDLETYTVFLSIQVSEIIYSVSYYFHLYVYLFA